MHDFRVVFGATHSNLIFDIAVSDEVPLSNDEIVRLLREEITKRLGAEYIPVITIDRDYTATRY